MSDGKGEIPTDPSVAQNIQPSNKSEQVSRRGLLSFSFIKAHPKSETTTQNNSSVALEATSIKPRVNLNRREFLNLLLASGATLATNHYVGGVVGATEGVPGSSTSQQDSPETSTHPNENSTKKTISPIAPKEVSYQESALQGALLALANAASIPILEKLKIPAGNAGTMTPEARERFLNMPFYQILLGGGVGLPVLEESIFRGLPQLIIDKAIKDNPRGNFWEVGVPVSILFALVHNFKEDPKGKTVFATDVIPLHQFVQGLAYWKIMRDRGLTHSMVTHAAHNSSLMIPLGVIKLLDRIFPEKQLKQRLMNKTVPSKPLGS